MKQQESARNTALHLSLHETRLSLATNNVTFLTYARQHLAALTAPDVGTPDIQVRLHWGPPPTSTRSPSNDYQRLGRRLLLGQDTIVQTEIVGLPGLQLRTTLTGAGLSIEATFQPPPHSQAVCFRFVGSDKPNVRLCHADLLPGLFPFVGPL